MDEAGFFDPGEQAVLQPGQDGAGGACAAGQPAAVRTAGRGYTYPEPLGCLGMAEVRMPLENTVDGSADGVSVYAAAARLIHNINHNEWLLDQEFDHGAIQ